MGMLAELFSRPILSDGLLGDAVAGEDRVHYEAEPVESDVLDEVVEPEKPAVVIIRGDDL